jgi:hypothetical protein
VTDEEIRARLLALWTKMGEGALKVHCGGRGLVVGCPVCKKKWSK